jgi:hypothetical protein
VDRRIVPEPGGRPAWTPGPIAGLVAFLAFDLFAFEALWGTSWAYSPDLGALALGVAIIAVLVASCPTTSVS